MKRFADGMAKELQVRQVMNAPIPFPLANPTEEAVVRPHKELAGAFDQYGPAIGANSRIDDGDMKLAAAKVCINSEQIERAGRNILRGTILSEADSPSG